MRPGQRLLALSDPIRGNEMWPITPSTSSLSRVRDAFKLRRAPTVDLVLSARSVEDQLEGAGGGPSAGPARPGAAGGNGSGALPGADAAQLSNTTGEWRGAAGALCWPVAAALGLCLF